MSEVPKSVVVEVKRRGFEFVKLHILGLMASMTAEERKSIINEFCRYCGDQDGPVCIGCMIP